MNSLSIIILVTATILGGCSDRRRPGVEGIAVAGSTTATLLTDRPARQVADCLASGLQASAQPYGAGYLIAGLGLQPITYRVLPIDDKLQRFVTQVEQSGTSRSDGFIAAICLAQRSGPAA